MPFPFSCGPVIREWFVKEIPDRKKIIIIIIIIVIIIIIIVIVIIIIIQCSTVNTISKKYTAINCRPGWQKEG